MTKFIFTLFSTLIALTSVSQNRVKPQNFQSLTDIFGTRTFVENKGQFDRRLKTDEKILYVLDNGTEKIYFTPSGLIYELNETQPRPKKETEENKIKTMFKTHFVKMQWLHADRKNIEVVALEKQNHYITYGEKELNSNTFKKIIYKNVYPHIDIEYTIPEEKSSGIKYSVIVYPGGDANQVKIHYTGDVKKTNLTRNGDLVIKTSANSLITEHEPYSFIQQKKEIKSSFNLIGDTIGFSIHENYDKNKTLIIDPWVTSSTNLSANNTAYDVDYDFSGFTYIYGGDTQYKVAKYASNGTLVWTFSGMILTNNWYSAPTPYVGNFCTDKYTGKIFIGQGVNTSGTQIVRLNSAGNYDNFISAPTTNY
jgi:hypothetical protein